MHEITALYLAREKDMSIRTQINMPGSPVTAIFTNTTVYDPFDSFLIELRTGDDRVIQQIQQIAATVGVTLKPVSGGGNIRVLGSSKVAYLGTFATQLLNHGLINDEDRSNLSVQILAAERNLRNRPRITRADPTVAQTDVFREIASP